MSEMNINNYMNFNYADYKNGSQINRQNNGLDKGQEDELDKVKNPVTNEKDEKEKKGIPGHKPQCECETCKKRKYLDASDEANVSFKSAAHVSPEAAASAVRAHENMHVANAYSKAAKAGGKVLTAYVTIKTSVCPECGRVYVAGGLTHTQIQYPNESNPYQKDRKAQDASTMTGQDADYSV